MASRESGRLARRKNYVRPILYYRFCSSFHIYYIIENDQGTLHTVIAVKVDVTLELQCKWRRVSGNLVIFRDWSEYPPLSRRLTGLISWEGVYHQFNTALKLIVWHANVLSTLLSLLDLGHPSLGDQWTKYTIFCTDKIIESDRHNVVIGDIYIYILPQRDL